MDEILHHLGWMKPDNAVPWPALCQEKPTANPAFVWETNPNLRTLKQEDTPNQGSFLDPCSKQAGASQKVDSGGLHWQLAAKNPSQNIFRLTLPSRRPSLQILPKAVRFACVILWSIVAQATHAPRESGQSSRRKGYSAQNKEHKLNLGTMRAS